MEEPVVDERVAGLAVVGDPEPVGVVVAGVGLPVQGQDVAVLGAAVLEEVPGLGGDAGRAQSPAAVREVVEADDAAGVAGPRGLVGPARVM